MSQMELKGQNTTDSCLCAFIVQAKAIMTEWLRNHQDNPYPNDDEKEELMQSTKLTINQINYWFTNARRRLLPKWSMIRRNAEEAKTSCGSPVMTPQMACFSPRYVFILTFSHGAWIGVCICQLLSSTAILSYVRFCRFFINTVRYIFDKFITLYAYTVLFIFILEHLCQSRVIVQPSFNFPIAYPRTFVLIQLLWFRAVFIMMRY